MIVSRVEWNSGRDANNWNNWGGTPKRVIILLVNLVVL